MVISQLDKRQSRDDLAAFWRLILAGVGTGAAPVVEMPEGARASLSCTWTLWAELWGLIVLAAGLPGPAATLKPGGHEGRCQAPPQGCQVGDQKQTPGQAGPWGTWVRSPRLLRADVHLLACGPMAGIDQLVSGGRQSPEISWG